MVQGRAEGSCTRAGIHAISVSRIATWSSRRLLQLASHWESQYLFYAKEAVKIYDEMVAWEPTNEQAKRLLKETQKLLKEAEEDSELQSKYNSTTLLVKR